jgi:hypothetical protein
MPEYCNTKGAAEFTQVPAATLATMRVRGGGPPFCKVGARVLYSYADLRAWIEAGRRVSTAA